MHHLFVFLFCNILEGILLYLIFCITFREKPDCRTFLAMLVCSQASAFEGSVFTHSDVKPGMLVKAKVIAAENFGAIVQFSGGVKALCPLQHMSELDILKPPKKFKVFSLFPFSFYWSMSLEKKHAPDILTVRSLKLTIPCILYFCFFVLLTCRLVLSWCFVC